MTVARCPWQGRVAIKLNSDLKLEVVNDGTNNNCVCIKFDREIDRDSDKLQKGTLPDRYLKTPGFDANAPTHIEKSFLEKKDLMAEGGYKIIPGSSRHAMLLALHRHTNPDKLVLTKAELKRHTLRLLETDDDLAPGSGPLWWVSFECIVRALDQHSPIQLLQREGDGDSVKYMPDERNAKAKVFYTVLSAWQDALDDARHEAALGPPRWAWAPAYGRDSEMPTRPFCVRLVADSREPKPDLDAQLRDIGIKQPHMNRELKVGDFLFVIEKENESPRVLPVVVERKTWSDLSASLIDGRWQNQTAKMERCGLTSKVYLVEGDPTSSIVSGR